MPSICLEVKPSLIAAGAVLASINLCTNRYTCGWLEIEMVQLNNQPKNGPLGRWTSEIEQISGVNCDEIAEVYDNLLNLVD